MVKGAEILEGETDLDWLAGEGGNALRVIEEASTVRLSARGNKVHLEGAAADVARVRVFLHDLARLRERGFALQAVDIRHAARAFFRDGEDIAAIFQEVVLVAPNKRAVSPKSLNQRATSTRSASTTSSSASAPPARARPTSPWPWRWP